MLLLNIPKFITFHVLIKFFTIYVHKILFVTMLYDDGRRWRRSFMLLCSCCLLTYCVLVFILTVPTFEMPKPLTHFKRVFFLKRFFRRNIKSIFVLLNGTSLKLYSLHLLWLHHLRKEHFLHFSHLKRL